MEQKKGASYPGKKTNKAEISDKTKEHIRKASEHDMAALKNQISAAPSVLVGAGQLAAGNIPGGAIALVTAAPGVIKTQYHQLKSGEHKIKTAISTVKDMKGKSMAEKASVGGSLVSKTSETYSSTCKDEVNKITPEHAEGIARNVIDTIGTFGSKSTGLSKTKTPQQKISTKNKNISI